MDLRVLVVGECLGFVIGAQLGLALGVALDGEYLGIPNDARLGFCIAISVLGGILGAVMGYLTNGWVTLGRYREPFFGAVAGCLLGLMAGIVYIGIATRDPQQPEDNWILMWDDNSARLRRFWLPLGLSAGSVLGGIVGWIVSRMRRR